MANDPSKWVTGPREDFNLYQAGGSAYAYGVAGGTAGFYLGCGIGGAISLGIGGAGCLPGAELGLIIGRVAGGVYGFFKGGYSISEYDPIDAFPNEVYLPRSK